MTTTMDNVLSDKKSKETRGETAVQTSSAQHIEGRQPIHPVIPNASYRLQLHKDFTFRQAAELIDYINTLGISHCYTSPWLKARPGSKHGYDIVDHTAINPEIGDLDSLTALVNELHSRNMGLIADIVPNHMAIMGSDNAWWLDVLENGPASLYARFFDIDWRPVKRELFNKIAVPVLGDHYGIILERGELQLVFDEQAGAFYVTYYEHRFPIDAKTYPAILHADYPGLEEEVGGDVIQEYQSLDNSFAKLPSRTMADPRSVEERKRDKEIFKQRLAELTTKQPALGHFIQARVAEINRVPLALSESQLHQLLEQQAYRLANWRVAGDEINYRRFFDINELAGLRAEDQEVFNATHSLILSLVQNGMIDGLRVDHADGLYDPVAYYQRLNQNLAEVLKGPLNQESPPIYLVAEKIVANYEYLSNRWPLHGTTGYEFASAVNGVFVDTAAEKILTQVYTRFVGQKPDFNQLVCEAKDHLMRTALASELNVLANQLNRISEANPRTRDFTLNALRGALREVVACFPVYRTYTNSPAVSKADRRYIDWAVSQARHRSRSPDKTVFDFIRQVLTVDTELDVDQQELVRFTQKFQQYTAPVMAKGYEDTALYEYLRLISLNEVGGDPRVFGTSINAFHHFNQERARQWPNAMLSLSTHDTKRSADVRARINVISEIPELWQASVTKWSRLNRRLKKRIDNRLVPSRNDEYLFYQTLVGSWPLEEQDETGWQQYRGRISDYMIKAAREAKLRTSWTNPDEDYEQALREFVDRALESNNPFVKDCERLIEKIAIPGLYNALSQTLLQLTSPGVPDIYQGEELWRFSLVDPDNRRAVDFAKRNRSLAGLYLLRQHSEVQRSNELREMLETIEDGRIKLFVILETLAFRNQYPDLFSRGDYVKLECYGAQAEHVIAFARHDQQQTAIIVVPRCVTELLPESTKRLPAAHWQDTYLHIPGALPATYREVFTGQMLDTQIVEQPVKEENANDSQENLVRGISVSDVLQNFPMALLYGNTKDEGSDNPML
jgi:(1->4)-alpha-D-glucan 1-alpha-D-glucosylmutase